mgnify:CR=1 FL=1
MHQRHSNLFVASDDRAVYKLSHPFLGGVVEGNCKGLLGRYARDRHVVDLCSFVWCFFVPGLLLSVIVNINFISVKKVGSITSAKT